MGKETEKTLEQRVANLEKIVERQKKQIAILLKFKSELQRLDDFLVEEDDDE